MMADARRGRFDVVLVWASDRIARSVKHFLEILDELRRLNIEFVSFREQLDTGGALGRRISRTSVRRVLCQKPPLSDAVTKGLETTAA